MLGDELIGRVPLTPKLVEMIIKARVENGYDDINIELIVNNEIDKSYSIILTRKEHYFHYVPGNRGLAPKL